MDRLSRQIMKMYVWLVALILACSQTVQCNGVAEVKALRYSSSCSDNWIFNTECDPYFQFCLKKSSSPSDSLSHCDYGSRGPTGYYENQNYIDFSGASSFAGGVSNPLRFEVTRFQGSDLKLVIEIIDDEFWQSNEHLVWLTLVFSHTPAGSLSSSSWTTRSTSRDGYTFQFQFRSYCTANYYTPSCDVYCLPQDNFGGHYTCNQETGAKVCLTGWTGQNCDIDVDECAQGTCRNGATCTNTPGSYSCRCPEYFTGRNCQLATSLCYSGPCQNGGTCSGNSLSFTCTCIAGWTGDTCQTMVNFCQSSPCLHGSTCNKHMGRYSCVCAEGWTGNNCETEVDPCVLSPCQHGGTCLKEPGGEYTCRCSADYGGTNCEIFLDPCLSAPCLNSGTCVRLTHSEFNCTCPVDYQGPTCEQYVDLCQSSPCQNAGSCTRLAYDSFQCTCPVDYRGPSCEEYIDPCLSRPCLNGATCTRLDYSKYTCTCPVDYTGTVCDEYIDPCSSLPCLNSAPCVRRAHDSYSCMCTDEYVGQNCSEKGVPAVHHSRAAALKDETLPVIIGVCIGCVIMLITALLIFLILKRRQRFLCMSREEGQPSAAYDNNIYVTGFEPYKTKPARGLEKL